MGERPVQRAIFLRRLLLLIAGVVCWALLSSGLVILPESKLATAEADDQPKPSRLGKAIRITLPIDSTTTDRVKRFIGRALERAEQQAASPVVIFEFQTPDDQQQFAQQSDFSAAFGLADYLASGELNRARTVAYIPRRLSGHAVLVALACDEIMMPADAELGPVGADPATLGSTERSAYREIADSRKNVPAEVALWLLDPSREVLLVETELSREFVTPEGLHELEKRRAVKSVKALRQWVSGPPGQFTGDEARRLNIVSFLPAERSDVAKALELPAGAIEEDPSMVDQWQAVRIDLKGVVTSDMAKQVERMIQDEIRLREANFICLWIDSPGGSPADSLVLAGYLGSLDPGRVRTVAYVPNQARSDAALIALACQQVVMRGDAELGGSGAADFSEDDIQYTVRSIRDPQSPWPRRSRSLAAAMIDPDLEVFRCTRLGETAYFSEEQLADIRRADPEGPPWQQGEQVTRPGSPLLLDGNTAERYGLIDLTVDSFQDLKQHYGLQDDMTLLEPGWADFLIEGLASPSVAAILLMVAFVALYAELNVPGIGVGAFIAALCFLLFFWSHYLGGTAGWLEILLFMTGIVCLLLEIFLLPGFGIFGFGGGLMILISLVLASQTFVFPRNDYQIDQLRQSLLTVAAAGVGIIAMALLLRRWLPGAPLVNQMLLEPPAGDEAEIIRQRESLVHCEGLLGAQGIATTQLTPGGKARFGDNLVNVITDGEVIARGSGVEVVEVHGNRVVVKMLDS